MKRQNTLTSLALAMALTPALLLCACPSQQVEQMKPLKGMEQMRPVEPEAQVDRTKQIEPAKQEKPVKQVEPEKQVGHVEPTKPVKQVEPAKHEKQAGPAQAKEKEKEEEKEKERRLTAEQIKELFSGLKKGSNAIESVKSNLVERIKNDTVFVDGERVGTGVFYFLKPNSVRKEIKKPKKMASIMVLTGKKLQILLPKIKGRPRPRLEIYVFKEKKRDAAKKDEDESESVLGMLAGLKLFDLDALKKKFAVTVFEEPSAKREKKETGKDARRYRINLVPLETQKGMKKKLSTLEIWTDGQTPWPLAVRTTDALGEQITTYEFGKIKINARVSPGKFRIKSPRGTEIVRYER